jgi:hypothetical protein
MAAATKAIEPATIIGDAKSLVMEESKETNPKKIRPPAAMADTTKQSLDRTGLFESRFSMFVPLFEHERQAAMNKESTQ